MGTGRSQDEFPSRVTIELSPWGMLAARICDVRTLNASKRPEKKRISSSLDVKPNQRKQRERRRRWNAIYLERFPSAKIGYKTHDSECLNYYTRHCYILTAGKGVESRY